MQLRPEEGDVVQLRHRGEARARLAARGRLDLDERARIGREDLGAGPGRHDPPLVEEREARGVLGLVHVGGRNDDREPLVVERVQDLPELAARNGVDARRRFVEEEKVRARQERRDERELLLHAAGEGAGEAGPESIEPDAGKKVLRARRGLVRRNGVEAGPERQVLVHREILVEREALGHESEGDVVAVGAAGRGLEQAGDDPEERRLAGAVGPDEREQLAARDREVDAAQRPAAPEGPDELRGADHLAEPAAASPAATFTRTSAGWPGTRGAFHPASRSTFAA